MEKKNELKTVFKEIYEFIKSEIMKKLILGVFAIGTPTLILVASVDHNFEKLKDEIIRLQEKGIPLEVKYEGISKLEDYIKQLEENGISLKISYEGVNNLKQVIAEINDNVIPVQVKYEGIDDFKQQIDELRGSIVPVKIKYEGLDKLEQQINNLEETFHAKLEKLPIFFRPAITGTDLKSKTQNEYMIQDMDTKHNDVVLPLMFDKNAKLNKKGTNLEDTTVEVTKSHKELLKDMLIALRPCAGEKNSEKVVLEMKGFASSSFFKGLSINDSNEWNKKAANRRALSAVEYLHKLSLNKDEKLDFGDALEIKYTPWKSYEDMAYQRPFVDMPNGGKSRAAEQLNRLIEVKLISAGRCNIVANFDESRFY
ncbi:MAG: hypothetical protein MI892_26615 [Desulfobacterales bacterium]|nr:hypothetical protein [Desulfobacterales bacterium]